MKNDYLSIAHTPSMRFLTSDYKYITGSCESSNGLFDATSVNTIYWNNAPTLKRPHPSSNILYILGGYVYCIPAGGRSRFMPARINRGKVRVKQEKCHYYPKVRMFCVINIVRVEVWGLDIDQTEKLQFI